MSMTMLPNENWANFMQRIRLRVCLSRFRCIDTGCTVYHVLILKYRISSWSAERVHYLYTFE